MGIKKNYSMHPTPQFERKEWMDLRGAWDFRFDKENLGEQKGYSSGFEREYHILVPFTYESKASGIDIQTPIENVWYQKKFTYTKGKRALLHFEGADYVTKVWVNGNFVGQNKGAYHAFCFDITERLLEGENLLVVKCEDSLDVNILRGKQRAADKNYECFYVQMTGIWKPVWIDFVGDIRVESLEYDTQITRKFLNVHYELLGDVKGAELEIEVSYDGKIVKTVREEICNQSGDLALSMPKDRGLNCLWNQAGELYDIRLSLKKDGVVHDEIISYVGMREISIRDNAVCLNNAIVHQKLVLYQGVWKDSLYTCPDDETAIRELTQIKEMGFNGIRVHEKTESERFLYFADMLGLLVWCEVPSAYEFSDRMKEGYVTEMSRILRQKRNHPSIITWVLFNESWGIGEIGKDKGMQTFADAMYYLAKSIDTTRPVIVNDGWEHTLSDIVTIHNYVQDANALYEGCKDADTQTETTLTAAKKKLFVEGYHYRGQPIILSEFGGCCFDCDTANGWGYGSSVKDEEEFLKRFKALYDTVRKLGFFAGSCYTQFNDVQQEKNGLFTENALPKVPIEKINEIVR